MIKAEIVAYSKNNQGDELMSVLATFPRIILAEVNTHRMLSKNTSSSRAIPFNKMVEAVQNNPFIPIAWQKEHSGMQGTEYIERQEAVQIRELQWLQARDSAIHAAKELNNCFVFDDGQPVTKQLANRLLEPFMWTTMLITGSKEGWDNFFHLRNPTYQLQCSAGSVHNYKSRKDALADRTDNWDDEFDFTSDIEWLKRNVGQAEIHMMALAEAIWDAKNESTPKLLQPGEWHIPFEDKIGFVGLGGGMHIQSMSAQQHTMTVRKVKVSTAMGARTSYTIVGEEKEINLENLIGLHDRLVTQQPPHSSPMEHCSKCMTEMEREEFIKGRAESVVDPDYPTFTFEDKSTGWCYNHKGFIPYRYMIDNNITL